MDYLSSTINVNNINIKFEKYLAEGGYAKVYIGHRINNTTEKYVLKIFSKITANSKNKESVEKEIQQYQKLTNNNKNIVKQYGSCQQNEDMIIVLEQAPGGNLADIQMDYVEIETNYQTDDQIWWIIYECSGSLIELHNIKIAHRDFKMQNILVGTDGKLKLADFGSCDERSQELSKMKYNEKMHIADIVTADTTPYLVSPEQYNIYSGQDVDQRVDLWAFGIIVYSLVFNQIPFTGGDRNKVMDQKQTIQPTRMNGQIKVHPTFNDILKSLFDLNPTHRITASELRKISAGMLGDRVNSTYMQLFSKAAKVDLQNVNMVQSRSVINNNDSNNIGNNSIFGSESYNSNVITTAQQSITSQFSDIQTKIESQIRRSTMYKAIVASTISDCDPPLLVNLLTIIDKCWNGKQNKFFMQLKKRNILINANVIGKGMILLLNILINGKQEDYDSIQNMIQAIEASNMYNLNKNKQEGSLEYMLNIIKQLRNIRLIQIGILDNNQSIEMAFVKGTYQELNRYELITNSNQAQKEIVKALHKLLTMDIPSDFSKIVLNFIQLALMDFSNQVRFLQNQIDAVALSNVSQDQQDLLYSQQVKIAYCQSEECMRKFNVQCNQQYEIPVFNQDELKSISYKVSQQLSVNIADIMLIKNFHTAFPLQRSMGLHLRTKLFDEDKFPQFNEYLVMREVNDDEDEDEDDMFGSLMQTKKTNVVTKDGPKRNMLSKNEMNSAIQKLDSNALKSLPQIKNITSVNDDNDDCISVNTNKIEDFDFDEYQNNRSNNKGDIKKNEVNSGSFDTDLFDFGNFGDNSGGNLPGNVNENANDMDLFNFSNINLSNLDDNKKKSVEATNELIFDMPNNNFSNNNTSNNSSVSTNNALFDFESQSTNKNTTNIINKQTENNSAKISSDTFQELINLNNNKTTINNEKIATDLFALNLNMSQNDNIEGLFNDKFTSDSKIDLDISSKFDLDNLMSNSNNSNRNQTINDSTPINQHQPLNPNSRTANKTPTPNNFQIPDDFKIDKNKLSLSDVVGTGGFSVVVRALQRGSDVVVKIISKKGASFFNSFVRECEMLKKLKNPHVAMLMGMYIDSYSDEYRKFLIAKEGDPLFCIVMEWCDGGSLFELLHEQKIKLSVLQKLKAVTGIVKAMLQIHSNDPPILHRDLKSLNILLANRVENAGSQVQVKVTDFGISKEAHEDESKMTNCVGSYHWMAPEVVKSHRYNEKADVWSFGVILYEILFNEIPYSDKSGPEVCILISEGRYKVHRMDVKDEIDKKLQFIMMRCLDYDVNKRQSFDQVLKDINELCKKMNIRF